MSTKIGTENISGFTDWIKNILGIDQPSAIKQGTVLTQAQELFNYAIKGGTLKRGDRGYKVQLLQFCLKLLGYKTYNTSTPDGIFGPMTENAVISFQKANGLMPSGVFDRYTATRLLWVLKQKTSLANIIPSALNSWVQEETQHKLQQKYPEYYSSQEIIQPKAGTDIKPILIGSLIILGAIMLARRQG